ncbi:MAG: hypothetical protein WCV62_03510 [Candidatus Peribacteraceae bacterium]|jgi:chromosome segregation ATPase
MADAITNAMLLEHMQAMRSGLEQKMGSLEQKMGSMEQKIENVKMDLQDFKMEVREGFEDARLHRRALQEDLEATIKLQAKHDSAISRLKRTAAA